MNLSQLMSPLGCGTRFPDIPVTSVACDSRQVEKGTVFVCIRGELQDGHSHAAEALQKGAVLLVCQRDCGVPNQVIVEDTRKAYGLLCSEFFGNPSRRLKLIGVTGTNGKTTTSWFIKQMLEDMGKPVGLIGTICNQISIPDSPAVQLPADHTTPDAWELQGLLRRMADRGCEYVVMEASSHALAQKRLEGCRFLCGVFTNLTPEHLDFHKTMEQYYQAKKSLFSISEKAAVNLDEAYGRRLAEELPPEQLVTFSTEKNEADYTAHQIVSNQEGSQFVVVGGGNQIARTSVPLPGGFSVSNAMAAISALAACGVPLEQAAGCLSRCGGVPGRTEVLSHGQPFTVMRDYAHTPDGLEKVLTAIRQLSSGRIITVFGCAGRRDRSRRPDMAETVARLSDLVVMTADNPREESLEQIFEDARPGLERQRTLCRVIPDRREAIRWAVSRCKAGDTLLLAGKGHEEYQVLADRTIYFDEKQIVEELLAQKGPGQASGQIQVNKKIGIKPAEDCRNQYTQDGVNK